MHEMTDEKIIRDTIAKIISGSQMTFYSILNDDYQGRVNSIVDLMQQSLSESERKREEAVNNSIKFAEWIHLNSWHYSDNNKNWFCIESETLRKQFKLSAELYESFLKQQEG